MRPTLRTTVVLAGLTAIGLALGPASAYAGKGKPSADRTAPRVSIGSPTAGASVNNPLTVTGSAYDDRSVSRVTVAVDGATPTVASGTSTWSWSAPTLAAGTHTVVAAAYDAAGNAVSATVSVSVAAPTTPTTTWSANGLTVSRTDLTNPQTSPAMLVGRGRSAERDGLSVLLYRDAMSWRPWAEFRTTTGVAQVQLPWPAVSSSDFYNTSYALDGKGGLWVLDGSGPVVVRHYSLSGSPLPSSLSLLSSTTYGNSDSRANDVLVLASGAVVGSFHQQGEAGAPQYSTVLYRDPAGVWSSTTLPMYTAVSKWASAQHPADGSIWLLGDSDAKHSVTAVHLTETASGLRTDWVDETWIDVATYGDNAPEGENPDLQLVSDPSTATLLAAYQGNVYRQFGDPATNGEKGAHVIVARIPASGALSFSSLDVWAQRVSRLTLSASGGTVWVGYHPVDPVTLGYDTVEIAQLAAGTWKGPITLGKVRDAGDPVGFSATSPRVFADMADGHLAEFTAR